MHSRPSSLLRQSGPNLDEIIRENDVDLRIRGSMILRTVASKGGAEAWDLITWSLQDEEVRVRRNAAKTLTVLAVVEPRVVVILVESSLGRKRQEHQKLRHQGT